MGRFFLIVAQVSATLLFIVHFQKSAGMSIAGLLVPMALIVLVVVNSLSFTRFVSWVIFAIAFFAFLVVLSAFTLRWRAEPGFDAVPFYRSILMYVLFVYISLGQMKILGGSHES